MATNMAIFVNGITYDLVGAQYKATWGSIDDEDQPGAGDTVFAPNESANTVNSRIIAEAKTDHNTLYDSSFDAGTPAMLFGGVR